MAGIKFGARIPVSGPVSSVERLIESTKLAEELDYDMVFGVDHIHNSFDRHKQYPVGMGSFKDPGNTLDPNEFETMTAYSFLAGATNRIEFGVGVMPLPLRADPIVLAKEVATMDALSGGRFVFGVGSANVSDREEFRAMGRPFSPYSERYDLMSEYVESMRTIWNNPVASYHGKYVNFDDLIVYPKPARHVPVWIGCYTLVGGPERPAVKFALDHADGWIYGFMMTPDHIRSMIDDFSKTAQQVGKDLTNFDWCMQLRLSIADTEEEARRNCQWLLEDQPEMAKYAGYMWKRKDTWRDAEGAEEAPRSSLTTAITGTPDDVKATVQAFVDAGSTHFDLWFMYSDYASLLRQIRLFATEVMPAFK